MKKIMIGLVSMMLLVGIAQAADLSVDDVLKNVQSNQKKIKDMYAETTTVITSNMTIPGSKDKGPQKMTQKGKMWTKGEDKSKVEIDEPIKQTTINNGDKMCIINETTGQKMVQDMKKLRKEKGIPEPSKELSIEKAKEFFDLSLRKQGNDYILTGIPKKADRVLTKLEFIVATDKWVPVKVLMYGPQNKLVSQSTVDYQKISDVWVPVKNKSSLTTPAGKMEMEMLFFNVKVNKGIGDGEFKIE